MKERIRNILLEFLIFESPMFKAVAIKYEGTVYVGEPWMGHADLVTKVAEETDDLELILGCTDGFVTSDGKFVTREQAKQMVGYGESEALKRVGMITT